MFLILLAACGNNDCDFYERCDGDTLLVCGERFHQRVDREVHEVACEAPNDICVEVGDTNAGCHYAPDACDGGFPRCDGDLLVVCAVFDSNVGYGEGTADRFETAFDCAGGGKVCGSDGDGHAACVDG